MTKSSCVTFREVFRDEGHIETRPRREEACVDGVDEGLRHLGETCSV